MKLTILLLSILALAACANKKQPDDVVAVKVGDEYYQVDQAAARSLEDKTEDRVMCTRRSVVGSNRKQNVCTTVTEMERERSEARRVIDKNNQIRNGRLAAEKQGN